MEEQILITKENYFQIFHSLKYGITNVTYESEEISMLFNRMITIINEFTGKDTVEQRKAIIESTENVEFKSIDIENVYQIIYKNHYNMVPVLSPENYMIEDFAKISKEKGIVCEINSFEPALYKYAKRISKQYNVKFTGTGFNGTVSALPVRKQIEEAFLAGKYNISFSADSFGVQTIRNHVSMYGTLIGRKFKVELSKGFITVHFKDAEESKNLMDSATEIFNKLGLKIGPEERNMFFNNLILSDANNVKIKTKELPSNFEVSVLNKNESLFEIPKFIPKLYGKEVTIEEYKNSKNWQRLGFASEYNWENDIKGDIDMYPKDARFDDVDLEEDKEPAKYDWGSDDDEF